MNRRNVLIGIGTVAVGSGAALGSGAFTTVEASRSVTVDVEGDANAFLALVANDNVSAVDNNGGNDSNELQIDLSSSFGAGSGDTGVNDNAITRIGALNSAGDGVATAAFQIQNNGPDPVDLSISDINGNGSILSLPTFVSSSDHTVDSNTTDFSNVADLKSNTITGFASEATAEVVVEIDTANNDVTPSDGVIEGITFTADRTA